MINLAGLVARAENSLISNSSSKIITILNETDEEVNSIASSGGLVGQMRESSVIHSVVDNFRIKVNSLTHVGGFVGESFGGDLTNNFVKNVDI